MGTDNRKNLTNVIDDLILHGPNYNVWQAVRMADSYVKKFYPDKDESHFDQSGISFRPYEKYEYPPGDIKSVRFEDNVFEFVLTFLGLYGVNSPLPRCYHEQVDFQQRIIGGGDVPLQNFLDIFNNRFYWLYYQAWKKYRFYLHLNSKDNNKVLQRINSFSGRGFFGKEKSTALSGFMMLKFSGLFSQKVRNKAGLNILLQYLFPHFNMKVSEFVPSWLEMTDLPTLGKSGFSLGETTFIGRRTLDYTSRICINIGPIRFEDYLNFLPGEENLSKLKELLEHYLNDGLEYDISFKIVSSSIVSVAWDDERLKLGSTLWLGRPEKEIVDLYMPYEQISGSEG